MFKGIYNVYFAGVQYSVVKVITNMSKNQAHQSYLILNYGGFCEFFSQYARNIHAESVAVRKFLRCVLLASERAPASPTSTASPLARAPPFTAMLQNSRCRESVTFPIRKFFRSDVERIESAFPCLLGLTILLLQAIFVSKKSNGKWKAQNKFVQFVQFVVKKINASLSAKHG